jgi:hypothetical protein
MWQCCDEKGDEDERTEHNHQAHQGNHRTINEIRNLSPRRFRQLEVALSKKLQPGLVQEHWHCVNTVAWMIGRTIGGGRAGESQTRTKKPARLSKHNSHCQCLFKFRQTQWKSILHSPDQWMPNAISPPPSDGTPENEAAN